MSFEDYVSRVNQKLDALLPDKNNLFAESMRYSALTIGKRFRPILTYTTADMFGANLDLVDSSACAVELIHVYSLIHDDLPAMDDDDIRHGQPACHKKFGEAHAILTGDGLQALAFDILVNDDCLSHHTRVKLLQTLTQAAFEMAQGQLIDLSMVSKTTDIATLENMYRKKTGALISCAIKLGALVTSQCSAQDFKILDEFSQDIGLAYQIQDDVLELLTPESTLGKRKNSDIKKDKPTYPAVLGLDVAQKAYHEIYTRAQNQLEKLSFSSDELKKLTVKLKKRNF